MGEILIKEPEQATTEEAQNQMLSEKISSSNSSTCCSYIHHQGQLFYVKMSEKKITIREDRTVEGV